MRLLGITIPNEKRLEIGLTSLYGIGRSRAVEILKESNIGAGKKPKDLSGKEENRIRNALEAYQLEGELKRDIAQNIRRLRDLNAYRGTRHTRRLPARGQRTKSNSRTVRGNVRKTMGSGKKKVEKK